MAVGHCGEKHQAQGKWGKKKYFEPQYYYYSKRKEIR
jgi:hypothetical protein